MTLRFLLNNDWIVSHTRIISTGHDQTKISKCLFFVVFRKNPFHNCLPVVSCVRILIDLPHLSPHFSFTIFLLVFDDDVLYHFCSSAFVCVFVPVCVCVRARVWVCEYVKAYLNYGFSCLFDFFFHRQSRILIGCFYSPSVYNKYNRKTFKKWHFLFSFSLFGFLVFTAERHLSRNILKGEMTVLAVHHAIMISFLMTWFFFVRQLFCRLFSGLVDYKVKPVVISTNLLAIWMSHSLSAWPGGCPVGSSLLMFTCHLTPFAWESRDIHLQQQLAARTTRTVVFLDGSWNVFTPCRIVDELPILHEFQVFNSLPTLDHPEMTFCGSTISVFRF